MKGRDMKQRNPAANQKGRTMNQETREEIDRYVQHKIPTGGFLQAVLENNLMESFARADEENARDMLNICQYVYCHTPMACHGSPEKVKAWLAQRKDET